MKPFRLDMLCSEHERSTFRCGEEALDRYFHTRVTQDIRRHIANCFVAVENETGAVAAFYTLSATSIPIHDLPPETSKRLPRYPTVPAVRIGRLAVDQRFQRRGLGEAMLADAVARAVKADIAAFMLVVDAKNDRAVAFYRRYGFCTIASQPRTLFLPLSTAQKALAMYLPDPKSPRFDEEG
jgi:ribosomal protein S18 acetylase RimI-like enzyme